MSKTSKRDLKLQQKEKYIKALLKKRSEIKERIEKIENELYNCETSFLEFSGGYPITKTLEQYLTTRVFQKKNIKEEDRIFSVEKHNDKSS
ncbi:hypothetical protein EDEG_00663 [Edhazardia aedis USNM 41457]|uniref:Chromatin modification-related protein EAF6 n=1 Tax=Edhazardia aedis (strain USNM 41457) TaxID=1003232 RepID=J9DVF5_EDHAE|nr:hypothetical protein EDEG_00663 [Edhazardia aedis USNM 41457]|eukprot:EJW05267.1 hypothetical protein EDEG_00663 [Edhazardia aedis USNM 41457]